MEMDRQITDTIMMVRPANFGYNPETAEDNAFQVLDTSLPATEVKIRAQEEFDAFVAKLRSVGVHVIEIEDSEEPRKTDSVFPNNWITFHDDGVVVTYPMFSELRRAERRRDIIDQLSEHFRIDRYVTLEAWEEQGRILEGTGSMILDRQHGILYAGLSERTDREAIDEFAQMMDYEAVVFEAVDRDGIPIYHTNVMMALGSTFCVICLEAIHHPQERTAVVASLEKTGKEIIDLNYDQVYEFAGNMLQVRGTEGKTYLVMSERAYRSLRPDQIQRLEAHTNLLYSPLDVIETYGGGSARCMMAEIFLPKREVSAG